MTATHASGAVDRLLNIHEISARTGHSPYRIRRLRVEGHELYSRAWKSGEAPNSPLRLEESIVDAWIRSRKAATAGRLS